VKRLTHLDRRPSFKRRSTWAQAAPKDVEAATGGVLFGHVQLLTQKGVFILVKPDPRALSEVL
jgi:hypothetical protein